MLGYVFGHIFRRWLKHDVITAANANSAVQVISIRKNNWEGITVTDANNEQKQGADPKHEGRDDYFMDIDRMVNEGLGGGNVTLQNGLIDESTTDTMEHESR